MPPSVFVSTAAVEDACAVSAGGAGADELEQFAHPPALEKSARASHLQSMW